MDKKGYLHIAEYDLTKKILDRLDIDIEEDYELVQGVNPLQYKDKTLILPSYENCISSSSDGVVFRPFTNVSHANYLINLFAEAKNCTAIFEYKDGKENTLDGKFKVTSVKKGTKEIKFHSIKNQSVLMATLVMKYLLSSEIFTLSVGSIFKIDRKMSEKHKVLV